MLLLRTTEPEISLSPVSLGQSHTYLLNPSCVDIKKLGSLTFVSALVPLVNSQTCASVDIQADFFQLVKGVGLF